MHEAPIAVTTAMGASWRTVTKRLMRYQSEDAKDLANRSSRPHRMRRATTTDVVQQGGR